MLIISVILLGFFIPAMNSQEISQYIQDVWRNVTLPHHDACVIESQIDPLIAETWLRDFHMPDDDYFGCFLKCLYSSLNFMRSDGTFDQHEIVDVAHYMDHDMAEMCLENIDVEENLCKKSYNLCWCVVHALAEWPEEY
ncbi:hypothetical protein PPYR_09176 [Photinus pyralis]|uniref:Uncharacterized protein n=2 Tax=Photinus pyralis TaxID=7054 RepID=A0A1Y1JWU4_PHOPY|nr:general odorant-binding protein 99b-like [Photinus pyralis]XP_031345040.1 general odorant-binding protein 99b-like [Photinus pyralis]XP_031345067.1 general odorant-binding protein 99b-like [Photinus pyralis]XP_031345068.1 general odorant-binding protein 99b-like [Photinus pyralis]KAB0798183.1 hypothetical protein PPYR_09176 [Photinus pyralis]